MSDTSQQILSKLSVAQLPWLQQPWAQWQSHQQANRLGHAYLIQAAGGLAVEVLVRHIAALRLCLQPDFDAQRSELTPCGQCSGCQMLQAAQHPDFYHLYCLEDKKEINIAQIRELIEQQNQTSHQGGYKVIWIQQVEKLSISAFNALLKSLEEPGENTLFLLTSSQAASLPATIRSRCQKLVVASPSLQVAQHWLAQYLPQQDNTMLKKALRVNWSAPLLAYEWVLQGRFNEEREWQNALQDLSVSPQGVNKVVLAWLKWSEPEAVFDYFYAWALAKVRKLGYGLPNLPAGEKSQAKLTMQLWLGFQNTVSLAKKDWFANANKELVLENLLMEWLRCFEQEKKGVFERNSTSVFKPERQRGSF